MHSVGGSVGTVEVLSGTAWGAAWAQHRYSVVDVRCLRYAPLVPMLCQNLHPPPRHYCCIKCQSWASSCKATAGGNTSGGKIFCVRQFVGGGLRMLCRRTGAGPTSSAFATVRPRHLWRPMRRIARAHTLCACNALACDLHCTPQLCPHSTDMCTCTAAVDKCAVRTLPLHCTYAPPTPYLRACRK